VNDTWLDLLGCPACGGSLDLGCFSDARYGCDEGVLRCATCGEWFPVTNGIPRLFARGPLRPNDHGFAARWADRLGIPSEDKGPLSAARADGATQVQSGFGFKWTNQAWWGIEGESARVMEEWLLPRYGWPDRDAYVSFMRQRSTMLDAGCGLGREALRMARANPGARVIGLELSECVDEAARHARERGLDNTLFIQADLNRPPLRRGAFDFIISEGVLHHTPDTHTAMQALVPLLASGGELAFYVYRKKAPLREYADDYIRGLIQDLSPEEAWDLMRPLTGLAQSLSELEARVEVPEDVEVLGIAAGDYDVQRLIYYAMFKCYWNAALPFEENVHVNFDWYYPRYAWRHTEAEVREWLAVAGLQIVNESIEESGITMRGRLC
jgi:SAM-dependent methyltransferase/uncharacterized protein YbaR (Trm112 family)